MPRFAALALLVVLAVSLLSGGVVTAQSNATATETVDSSVATDGSVSGFTLTAGLIAVLVGGTYWYYRR